MSGLDIPLTPLRFLERSAGVFPTKTAIIDGPRSLSYAEMAEQVQQVAGAIRAAGVAPGESVVYVATNSAELVMAHFAVPLAGAVLVATNTRLSTPEIAYILEHSEARLVLIEEELAATHGEMLRASGVPVVALPAQDGTDTQIDGATPWSRFRATGEGTELPWTVEDETATISLNYTSGTTGRPKGVMYTHRGAHLNALGQCLHQVFVPETRYLWTLPLFHCNGWCSAWAVTALGGTQVCLRAVRGPDVWRLIRDEGITHMAGAPTVLSIMAGAEEAAPLTEPLSVATAGAPPSPTIIETFTELGVTVIHVFGLTETYGPYSSCEWQEEWAELSTPELAVRLARQGVGMTTADDLRVIRHDEGGDPDAPLVDVPADQATIGEIVMRGNTVMKGYFKDEEATAEAFRGGWFHSGDLGVLHADGYVQLVDRAKDVVISGGENISTIEIEQALMRHPAVSEVAVIGVPDERWGERPQAYVTCRAGQQPDEAELIAHVKTLLASFKAPKAVVFVEDLPKTATGKIRKNELKDAAWAGHETRIQG